VKAPSQRLNSTRELGHWPRGKITLEDNEKAFGAWDRML
jgi:hypothetical protein